MTIKLRATTGGGSVSLSAPNSTTSNLDVALTLPVDDGTSGQVLVTNGTGTLSWGAGSQWTTSGSNIYYTTGSVGIGTTAPSYLLDLLGSVPRIRVKDSSTGAAFHHFENNSGNFYLGIDNSTGGSLGAGNYARVLWSQGAYPLVFATNDTQRAQIDSSGRLLVGTTSAFSAGSVTQITKTGAANGSQTDALVINNDNSNQNDNLETSIAFVRSGNSASNIYTRLSSVRTGTHDTDFRVSVNSGGTLTERMRIDSNGFVNIGAYTIPSSTPGMQLYGAGNLIFCKRSDTGEAISFFANSTTKVGNIVLGASSTTYNTSSDYRLKENVVPLAGATERLKQLPVHRFNFIVEPDKTVDGFLAHEAADVVPECVTGEKDAVDDDGNPIYQGIDQSKLVPLLTAALQEAVQRIETLETANASLEARLTALEGGAS